MTNWHGVTLDARSAAMMDEVERLCAGIVIDPTQGSWSGADASAGTHSGAGAIDIAAANLPQSHRDRIVYEMRRVGWAAWCRTPYQSDWPWHIHGVACAEPGLSGPARDQEQDYYAGRNGLANGAPDDGPRDFVGTTWEAYQRGKHGDQEDDMKIIWLLPSGTGGILTGNSFCGIGGDEASQLRSLGWGEVQVDADTAQIWRQSGITGL